MIILFNVIQNDNFYVYKQNISKIIDFSFKILLKIIKKTQLRKIVKYII